MLLLHAGDSCSMLLLCCPQLGLEALSLGLAVTNLMPEISKHGPCCVEVLAMSFDCCYLSALHMHRLVKHSLSLICMAHKQAWGHRVNRKVKSRTKCH